MLELLIVAPLVSLTLCFCFSSRDRRLKAIALAEAKKQTETNPHYVQLKIAELRLAEEETGPKMLAAHGTNGAKVMVVDDDDCSER